MHVTQLRAAEVCLDFGGPARQLCPVKRIPLEDNFSDVLGKAQRGLQLSDEALAKNASVSVADLNRVKGGQFDEAVVRKLTAALRLDADALVALGKQTWYPSEPGDIPGLACFNTTYGDMTVNSYFVWDPKSDNGVCFDTGADAAEMLKFAADRSIRVQLLLLTHTHADHVADLERVKQLPEVAAFVSKTEAIDGAETFEVGRKFVVGALQIETRPTSGHSRGGVTYVIHGLPRRIAVVGDSMFAASMGGGAVSYQDALKNNCEQILTLPEDTVLCPGHGPLTTVGEEKAHNPFFPQAR
jgi:hydroxyacylglutathione hydrolase